MLCAPYKENCLCKIWESGRRLQEREDHSRIHDPFSHRVDLIVPGIPAPRILLTLGWLLGASCADWAEFCELWWMYPWICQQESVQSSVQREKRHFLGLAKFSFRPFLLHVDGEDVSPPSSSVQICWLCWQAYLPSFHVFLLFTAH